MRVHPGARIFCVADAFDAMTSDRVYRKGRPYEAALEELDRCAGAHFDAQVVEAFHRVPPHVWGGELRIETLNKLREKKLAHSEDDNVGETWSVRRNQAASVGLVAV